MTATALERIRHPTGLARTEIDGLKPGERRRLAEWTAKVAGDDDGRPWIPGAVRALSLEERLALATDDLRNLAWIERERRRVERSLHYFVPAYGHVQDDEQAGPAQPFLLWPTVDVAASRAIGAHDQAEVLDLFLAVARIVVLKARQLGLTWLALHYGYWLQAFEPRSSSATILGLSQDGTYAKRLLERQRRINALLPSFLRHREDRETRDSKTEFKLDGRGRMVSLQGTKDAPRSWQSRLAICDEWAFVRNGQAGPTMRALLSAARQIIAVSTGNGPPDEPGWHQHFAQLWTRAHAGENTFRAVFLPTSTHPARDQTWRDLEVDDYDTEEEFLAEHPESPDEALIGAGRDRYFKLAEINAAVALGRELDRQLGAGGLEPSGGAIAAGLDHGEHMHGLPIWPLEGGGVYVPPGETVVEKSEPGEASTDFHRRILDEIQEVNPRTGTLEPPLEELRYDAAGIQSQRTFTATARRRHAAQYLHGEVRSRKIRFNEYKTSSAKYLRRLFRRVGQGRETQVIAISPANETLIRQLRALESGPGGVWRKDEDQHGPDALVAGVTPIANRHRAPDDSDEGVEDRP